MRYAIALVSLISLISQPNVEVYREEVYQEYQPYVYQITEIPEPAIQDKIKNKAIEYGVPAHIALGVARCESGFNPIAINSKDPDGGSFGLYQFQLGTWNHFRTKYGIGDEIFNADNQIEVAIRMMSDGYYSRWTCYRKLYENPPA